MKKYFLILLILLINYCAYSNDHDIFEAMQIEIQRAKENLKIEKMEEPYFFALRLVESNNKYYLYDFGILYDESKNSPYREIQALVRINNNEFDNSNYTERGGSWNSVLSAVPLEDDMLTLRQMFWMSIDNAYKNSLQVFSAKKAYLQQHPQNEYLIDFLPITEKTEMFIEPQYIENIDEIKSYTQKLSSYLRNYPFLNKGRVSASIYNYVQYYMDSDGNRYKRPDIFIVINLYLTAYTKDWYQIINNETWVAKNLEDFPKLEDAISHISEIANYIKDILNQKPFEEYTGPVVFIDQAAAKFFFDLFGKGVSLIREKLGEEEYGDSWKKYRGFLLRKFNQRILPISYQIWDKPNAKNISDIDLIGYMLVDDEGVKSKDIQLVKDGKIIAYPTRRTATKKYSEINGHARSISLSIPDSYITNLFVQDDKALDENDFYNKIKEIAEEEGLEEILLVSKLKNDDIYSYEDYLDFMSLEREGSLLSRPDIMYLYNVKTKEKKPIWGLEFSKVNENVLKDIVASSKKMNLIQFYPANSLWQIPISIYCPNIIIENATLVKTQKQMLNPYPIQMPKLDKEK